MVKVCWIFRGGPPTSYKWDYNNSYTWPYKWVTGVISLLMGVCSGVWNKTTIGWFCRCVFSRYTYGITMVGVISLRPYNRGPTKKLGFESSHINGCKIFWKYPIPWDESGRFTYMEWLIFVGRCRQIYNRPVDAMVALYPNKNVLEGLFVRHFTEWSSIIHHHHHHHHHHHQFHSIPHVWENVFHVTSSTRSCARSWTVSLCTWREWWKSFTFEGPRSTGWAVIKPIAVNGVGVTYITVIHGRKSKGFHWGSFFPTCRSYDSLHL